MGMLKVKVLDVSGSRVSEVEAPDDVAINRLLVVLIERMNLPLNSPDGQLMSYKLHHRRTGSQLLDNQTLSQANVYSGDELRLQPEITAG
jgi:WXG100 protein secretion system (Wss), protein YukD